MTLTLADVAKWNPEAIRDVATAVTKKGASAQEVADGLKQLPIIASWEGKAGEAARESLSSLAAFLSHHTAQMEALNRALTTAADDVESVKRSLSAMQTEAHDKHFNVNYQTGAVTATDGTIGATAAADQAKLEADVAKILTTANGVDQGLATALSNATGPPSVGAAMPGSLPFTIDTVNTPPKPSERFSAAARYIYNEIATNRVSQTARELKNRLSPPVSVLDSGFAARDFFNKVRSGGEWDHKPKIEKLLGIESPNKLDANHYFQVPGTRKAALYDIYSNIHYGYLGREVGIPPENLIWATGLNTAATATNDDGDIITMRAGVALYDKYGPNMTANQFHAGLIEVVNQLDAAKKAGQNVPQIVYLP